MGHELCDSGGKPLWSAGPQTLSVCACPTIYPRRTSGKVVEPSATRSVESDCINLRGHLWTNPNYSSEFTVNPQIFGGKPIIRGRRLVEHAPAMLAAGHSETGRRI